MYLVIEERFCKFESEGQKFARFLSKGSKRFFKKEYFSTCYSRFKSDSMFPLQVISAQHLKIQGADRISSTYSLTISKKFQIVADFTKFANMLHSLLCNRI